MEIEVRTREKRPVFAHAVGLLRAQAKSPNMANATAALTLGDTYYAAGGANSYKTAYKQYQKAYGLAVQ